ncbi:hypothetical protein [Actinomadura sp. NEAU-AAG7]|uniref:hypothetical protein n=1 Tax=Actinomadura sp. NEAU-AAG7 TaxID=2839640 RepID=UPI001BE4A445|nr:hypothetical protein [Actinomadura sp. NEAU-AAG7]MBT2213461.1 hypothetical protein [Actinomadura sp. NEAU-AAG7]
MATLVLTDVTTLVAGHNFTTDSNEVSLSVEVDDQENTTFGGNGYRSRVGGLKSVEAEINGYWQSAETGAVDADVFANLGSRDEVVTVSPTGAAGSTAYLFQAGRFTYEILGDIGDVAPFTLSMMSTNRVGLVRGKVAVPAGVVSTTGPIGTGVTGLTPTNDVPAGRYLYAAVHVLAAGASLTLAVEGDSAPGFPAPSTVATLPPVTSPGGLWMTRLAGPVAHTYYRLTATAISGAFTVAGAIGVA